MIKTNPLTKEYVVFVRTNPTLWAALPVAQRDSNTLYFVAETNASTGKLYLGNKLISDGSQSAATTLEQLTDVLIDSALNSNDILVFNETEGGWVPTPIATVVSQLVSVMVGATDSADGASGLVPTPTKSDKNLFLQGNGTWADPTATLAPIVSQLQTTTGNLRDEVDTLWGTNTADSGNSIRQIATNVATDLIASVVADAPEDFDTLKEIADWISKDENNGAAFDIATLQTKVGNIEDTLNGTDSTDGLIATVNDLSVKIYGGGNDSGLIDNVNELITQVSTNTTAIGTLNSSITTIQGDITTINNNITDIEERLCWRELVNEE